MIQIARNILYDLEKNVAKFNIKTKRRYLETLINLLDEESPDLFELRSLKAKTTASKMFSTVIRTRRLKPNDDKKTKFLGQVHETKRELTKRSVMNF